MVKVKQNLISSSKYSIKCPYSMTAQYITYHNTANDASAQNEIKYMIGNNSQVSYHFAVDDKEVVQGLPLNRNAWHCGDGNGDGNRKSIGVEVCYSKSGGTRYYNAEKLANKFIAQLLHERGWGIDRVRTHFSWSRKKCPHRILDEGRWNATLQDIQNELNKLKGTPSPSKPSTPTITALKYGDTGDSVRVYQDKLSRAGYPLVLDGSFGSVMRSTVRKFQSDNNLVVDGLLGPATQKRLDEVLIAMNNSQEKGDLTMKQYNELKKEIEALKNKLGTNRDVSSGFKNDWKWAEDKGLLDGSRPSHPVTREQMSAILHRYHNGNSLSPTAKKDLVEVLEKAYNDGVNGIFSENHATNAEDLSEHQIINLLISLVNRTFKELESDE